MFVLVEIKDTVRIPPWLFNVRFNDAVVEALNKKFANKVIFVTFFVDHCLPKNKHFLHVL